MVTHATCPSCSAPLATVTGADEPPARCPRCGAAVPPQTPEARAEPIDLALDAETGGPHATLASPPGIPTPGQFQFLAPPQQNDEIGRLGPYRVLGPLGYGGMGAVFRAEDPTLQREVALKVMLPEYAADPDAKARFLREARAQAKVHHEHIVAIFQVGEDRDIPYIAMPLLKGMTLQAALQANPRPPIQEVLRIGREIAEGLAAAHEQGLIHRDIKPANVWLEGKRLRVRILDFGIARITSSDGSPRTVLTGKGMVLGTPSYMSPEQARNLKLDARSDLFSLGVVMYEMCAGVLPFAGENVVELLTALAIETPRSPVEVNPAVPPALSALVMQLLAKKAAGRPPSAEALAAEIRLIEAGAGAPRPLPNQTPPSFAALEPGADPFAAFDSPRSAPDFNIVDPSGRALAAVPVATPASAAVPMATAVPTGAVAPVAAPAPETAPAPGKAEPRAKVDSQIWAVAVGMLFAAALIFLMARLFG
ncbi:serine threonine-protein kinase : Serine/threonine protein kinase (Fragment) OS=Rhodopirellula maiorica SM1 GN=RMSM_03539 PE=4 SV=1: Pkinase [Gemmataceae bacterium]